MPDERWAQISRIYNDAAALAPVDRAVFLRNACGDDETLRAEIETLLLDDSHLNALLESKGSQRTLIGQRIGRALGETTTWTPTAVFSSM